MVCRSFIFPLLLMIVFIFSACGVSTSSSGASANTTATETNTTTVPETNTTTVPETNTTTVPETNTTTVPETNTTTVPETNTTTVPETNTTIGDDTNISSDFDIRNAILDENACGAFTGFTAIKDNSFDPEGFFDETNSITIGSSYPLSFNPKESEVTLYRPNLTKVKTDSFVTIRESGYYISFDKAWITNEQKTVYVKTPQKTQTNGKFGCYRYIFDSEDSDELNATKVYRL